MRNKENNMDLYNELSYVPEEAKKPITAGKLKGFTNVNPQFRIKAVTKALGSCGDGWKVEITNKMLQPIGDGQVACFVDINFYYRLEDGTFSAPIPGTGGSMFVSSTKNGLQVSDECYKMALTDALSVAMKFIGTAGDVYYREESTKYGMFGDNNNIISEQPAWPPYPVPSGYPAEQPSGYYQNPYQQPVVYPEQPAPVPYPEQPAPLEVITLDQAKATVCSVGIQKGKTLGEILTMPRGMDSLNFISRMAPTEREKEAARILKQSLLM